MILNLPPIRFSLSALVTPLTGALPDWALLAGLLLLVSCGSVLSACLVLGIGPLHSHSGESADEGGA